MTIPIQPDFYRGMDSQKVDISDQKADIDAQNVNIGGQKVDISTQKVDIEKLKEEYPPSPFFKPIKI